MAQLRGFEQDPTGAPGMGLFHFDDGTSLYGHNPELAGALASNGAGGVENRNDAGAGGIAGGGGAPYVPPPSVADVGPNMSPAPEYTPATVPQLASVQSPMSAPVPQAPQAPQAPLQVPQGPQIAPLIRTGARPETVVPTSKTVEQKGGLPFTKAEEESRWRAFEDRMMARQRAVNDTGIQLDALQQHRARQALAFQQAYSDATRERDEALSGQVDPDRYFQKRGAAWHISAAIAQGMMQFGAALTHMPNPMIDFVDRLKNEDIHLQQEEYRRKGLAANNKLTDLMQKYQLDSQSAGEMLKRLQGIVAAQIGQQYANASGSKELQNAWATHLADETSKLSDENAKMLRDSYGTRTEHLAAKIQPATSGGVGINPQYKTLLELRKLESAAGASVPPVLQPLFGTDKAAAAQSASDYIVQHPDSKDPYGDWVAHMVSVAKPPGGGGSGGARLAGAAERAGLAIRALSELEDAYNAGESRGTIAGKLAQVGNWAQQAFVGGEEPSRRLATRMGGIAETAAALSGSGNPNEILLKEVGRAFDTNDPNAIRGAIQHYKGMLEEAQRRYLSRVGPGKFDTSTEDVTDEGMQRGE
jgi:hypothetical protein